MFRMILAISLSILATPAFAEADKTDGGDIGVRISLKGDVLGNNFAAILTDVYRHSPDLLQIEPVSVGRSGICGVLASRNYPAPCEAYLSLINRINSAASNPPSSSPGSLLLVPSIAVEKEKSVRVFSKGSSQEQAKARELVKNWKSLGAEAIETQSEVGVQFDSYNFLIRTPDDSSAQRLFDALINRRSKNVLINLLTEAVNPPAKLNQFTLAAANDFQSACTDGSIAKNIENGSALLPLMQYLQFMDGDSDAKPFLMPTVVPKKVTVTLVDTVLNEFDNGPLANPWKCSWGNFVPSQHHANHLRGIIKSVGPVNLFEGLTSQVDVTGISWWRPDKDKPMELVKGSTNRSNDLAAKISNAWNTQPLPIYLVATDFDGYSSALRTDDGHLDKRESRFGREPEDTIRQVRPLLIVAAGQPSEFKPGPAKPVALTPRSPRSPQNLGDLENVIVVTTCADCSGVSPKIDERVNYGEEGEYTVHLAAPGGNPIVGWIDGDTIGAAGGTSQSAAMVAGVAANMLSKFWDSFGSAVSVKVRLQATSRPFPPNAGAEGQKISAGLVDPYLAQLDPTKTWSKLTGKWQPLKAKGWSTPYLTFVQQSGRVFAVDASSVLRFVKTQVDAEDVAPLYSMYVDALRNKSGSPGVVERYDKIQRVVDASLVLCDGSKLQLTKLDDLLLASTGIQPNACP